MSGVVRGGPGPGREGELAEGEFVGAVGGRAGAWDVVRPGFELTFAPGGSFGRDVGVGFEGCDYCACAGAWDDEKGEVEWGACIWCVCWVGALVR